MHYKGDNHIPKCSRGEVFCRIYGRKSCFTALFIHRRKTKFQTVYQASKYLKIGTCPASQKILACIGIFLIFTRNNKIFTCPAAWGTRKYELTSAIFEPCISDDIPPPVYPTIYHPKWTFKLHFICDFCTKKSRFWGLVKAYRQHCKILQTIIVYYRYQVLKSGKEKYLYTYTDTTVVPTKSDSDIKLCLQLLSKTLTCTLHLS